MKKAFLLLFVMAILGIAKAQNYHWTPTSGYQYNMTVNGVILIDGVEQQLTTLQVGAFCGDESRAYSYCAQYFPPTNQYVVTVTILSDVPSGETITFRLYDQVNDKELDLDCVNTVTFESNASIPPAGTTDWFELAFVTPTPPVTAVHFTTAGNWSTASNWEGGALPGASDEVIIDANCTLDQNVEVADLTISNGFALTIQSGKTLTVTGDLTNTVATGLVLQDGAQLINASANVEATAVKNIVAYDANNPDGWYAIASPVNEMSIEGSDFLTPEYDLFRYNEPTHEWENYKAGAFTTFENGRGYLYANNSTPTPEFVGILNNAAVTVPVTFTASAGDLKGFNLIGNPFPHVIYKGNGGAIDNANLASGYYTLDNEGAWHVHTYEDGIMPGQGILVKTTTTDNVSIVKSTTEATTESSGAKSASGRIDVYLKGNNCEDRSFVYFSEGIGLSKMNNLSDAPGIGIRFKGEDFAIAHLDESCESVGLFFDNSREGDFNVSFKVKDSSFSYLRLIDNVAGSVVDLLQQDEYGFHATGNESAARFRLEFKVSTDVGEEAVAAPFAYVGDGQIILTDVDENARVQIMDLTGRLITGRAGAGTVSTEGMASGVYVLRLVNNNNVKSQKIIIP